MDVEVSRFQKAYVCTSFKGELSATGAAHELFFLVIIDVPELPDDRSRRAPPLVPERHMFWLVIRIFLVR
jgi:hypothetical protein